MSEAIDQPGVDEDLASIDVSDPMIFKNDAFRPVFARLRKEAPVHYCRDSPFGPYWSITRFHDIMAVDKNHHDFSSQGGVSIGNRSADFEAPNFISMDPPKHDLQRKAVTGVVAPMNLAKLEPVIRQRAGWILDELPSGESFNWVEHVSIELTTQMLATIFDFPFEQRRKLTDWSDLVTSSVAAGGTVPDEDRREGLMQCLSEFTDLWNERVHWDPKQHNDLITLMANDPATAEMDPMEYLGNLILLIVGGNDTTRNSISGGVLGLNLYPEEYQKLNANPGLVPSMIPEIIRWQTPLTHMRRIAKRDVSFQGQSIKAGDKVLMWYLSGNRDETAIEDPERFWIDRQNPRHHLSFGFGIHRCMGNRLAEMQLRVLWEEIIKRFERVEVVGEPVRVASNFVRGISDLPVRLHRRKARTG
ncbi:MAG: cytochrome P450 [Candidatus Azotimanducaceae bacterium]|jgi:cytochrome P450|tara:strand:+ start:1513 stop:2763 length:1251 start_codon:yes stop_codon:yes gene_type:complete